VAELDILITDLGALDIVLAPDSAPRGFDDIVDDATERPALAGDGRALVISVDTWERLKPAAGRAKDLEQLDGSRDDRD
jgi:hypothetical protein